MKNKTSSYTSAGVFPIKLLKKSSDIFSEGKVLPYHVQLNLTNKCNLSCSFCSCANRDEGVEMSLSKVMDVMDTFHKTGCRAVTLTGGGEPLFHKDIKDILHFLLYTLCLDVGLVTNGILLNRVNSSIIDDVSWIRVSFDDNRRFEGLFENNLKKKCDSCKQVDWSFSYVLSKKPDYTNIKKVIRFANENSFSHVRLVSDLLDLDNIVDMWEVKDKLDYDRVDDSLVIYQGRKEFFHGVKDCLISLLKPVVSADGYIYPCCGVQYALKEPSMDLEESMKMGTVQDIFTIWNNQIQFDGSNCVKCYYNNYNDVLSKLKEEVVHLEFV